MVDLGIHVRVKAVLTWRSLHPCGRWLLIREDDGRDRLTAFETVFPWCDQTPGRAILIRKWFAVDARGHQREGIHRLVHSQAFGVWPVQQEPILLPGQLFRIVQRLEHDMCGPGSRL